MTSTGFVKELDGNMATVRFIRESACGGNCASCSGCKSKPVDVILINTLSLEVGDKVEIESDSNKILKSAFVLYILPLIVFFSAYILLNGCFGEVIGILAGFFGFFLSFVAVRKYGKKLDIKYEMVRKIN